MRYTIKTFALKRACTSIAKSRKVSRYIFICLSFLWATVCNSQQIKIKTIDVYLIGGQSNATGQGYLVNLPIDFKFNKEVIIFHSGKPHLFSGLEPYTWLPLHQASESPDRFGPELGFGNRIKELFPNNKIAIIKHAHSGTNLFNEWKPGSDLTDTLHWGFQFSIFVQTVSAGLDSLKQLGYQPVIKGMLWQQGESDADAGGEMAMQYGKNLHNFIVRVRQQFNCPQMLFVYGFVYPPPNTVPGSLFVRKGEYLVSEKSGDSLAVKGASVVPTDGLSHRASDKNTRYPKDFVHFGTDGTYRLGVRMADVMAEAIQNQNAK